MAQLGDFAQGTMGRLHCKVTKSHHRRGQDDNQQPGVLEQQTNGVLEHKEGEDSHPDHHEGGQPDHLEDSQSDRTDDKLTLEAQTLHIARRDKEQGFLSIFFFV